MDPDRNSVHKLYENFVFARVWYLFLAEVFLKCALLWWLLSSSHGMAVLPFKQTSNIFCQNLESNLGIKIPCSGGTDCPDWQSSRYGVVRVSVVIGVDVYGVGSVNVVVGVDVVRVGSF